MRTLVIFSLLIVMTVAGLANADTLTLREGLAGYAGTQDTWFSHRSFEAGGKPTGTYFRTAIWGNPPTDGANQQALLRFDGIFDNDGGSIPTVVEQHESLVEVRVSQNTAELPAFFPVLARNFSGLLHVNA